MAADLVPVLTPRPEEARAGARVAPQFDWFSRPAGCHDEVAEVRDAPTVKADLKVACEELGAAKAEAPVLVAVLHHGDHHVPRADATSALQLLTDQSVQSHLLFAGSQTSTSRDGVVVETYAGASW